MQEYRRKEQTTVVAVRLELETNGFRYRKWGGEQRCKMGDWIVNNDGDVYTVDAETFDKTYRSVGRGVFRKDSRVWAERAKAAGVIRTKEGATEYQAGDVLVFNDAKGSDGYAMSADKFQKLYDAAG